jgi:hypothetical protein
MSANPSPSDSSAYFESLLHVGQQSMKQFDDALATTLGVDGKLSTSEVTSPFSFAMNTPVLDTDLAVLERDLCQGFCAWRELKHSAGAGRPMFPGQGLAPGALLRSSQAIRRKHCNDPCPMMP